MCYSIKSAPTEGDFESEAVGCVYVARGNVASLSWPVNGGVGHSVQLLSQFRYDL